MTTSHLEINTAAPILTNCGNLTRDMPAQDARNIAALLILDDDEFEATSGVEWGRLDGERAYSAAEIFDLVAAWVCSAPDAMCPDLF